MSKGIKFAISMGVFVLFGCIHWGCEQPCVRKTGGDIAPQAQESKEAAKAETSASHEAKSCCAGKKEESASHSKDKRTIQQIISEITGEKIGPDNSGDLYSGGLTATYTRPEQVLPGEGKFGKLFNFLPLIRWYDPDHYYTPNMAVSGEFKHEECVMCHTVQTPGIVAQW
ncbi:MAG: hydroxylamine oxidoreductase, partial [Planctomycetota bacterium]|nr:hydroxylamine oxidoreductase [Planctomycetota bacterium]